jgi:hypothetical protein
MATIINTLEVVLDQPTKAAPAPAAGPLPQRPPSGPLTPLDVDDIFERQARLAMRVAAH